MGTILTSGCIVLMLLGADAPDSDSAVRAARAEQTIVLLHGMGRTRVSMMVLEQRLRKAGFKTLNFPYEIHGATLDDMAAKLHAYVEEKVETPVYHFIGHSLGNIIVRHASRTPFREGLGRVVMLAPPNQPAHLALRLGDNALFKLFTQDSGQKLGSPEFYAELPAPPVEFGIIAGDRGQRLTFDEGNDGIVTVESTKLEGMKDWLLLHHTHTFMMNAKDTAAHCVYFIEHGQFERVEGEGTAPGDSDEGM